MLNSSAAPSCAVPTLMTGTPLLKRSHEDTGVGLRRVDTSGQRHRAGAGESDREEGQLGQTPLPLSLPEECGPAEPPSSGSVWQSVLMGTSPSFLESLQSGWEGLHYPDAFISG